MEYAIEIQGLKKKYKGFFLDDVSFNVPQGYIMGLIGPNGAGKTTIIKLIMNLIKRNAGEIRVFGKDNIQHEAEIKAHIGFVYDVPPFFEDVRLKDLKSAIAPFYVKWNDKIFLKIVEEFDLNLEKKFKKISHGMKMKFALALALSHEADLILMDEPTSGLDPVFRFELLDRLSALIQDEKKTVLFSTHITSDLERIADFITFINDGHIIFSTDKDDILDNWGVIKAGREFLEKNSIPGLKGFRQSQYGVEILTSQAQQVSKGLSSGNVIDKAKLEDIMYFLGRGENHA